MSGDDMGKPVLVFLHGVGTGDPAGEWKRALSASLSRVGYPDLESAHVIAPRYAGALKFDEEELPLPPLTAKPPEMPPGRIVVTSSAGCRLSSPGWEPTTPGRD